MHAYLPVPSFVSAAEALSRVDGGMEDLLRRVIKRSIEVI
jgi:hypothetical protein